MGELIAITAPMNQKNLVMERLICTAQNRQQAR
jgi:hypothetical protein